MQRLLIAPVLLLVAIFLSFDTAGSSHQSKYATLSVLISAANYIYYYENDLQKDGSNFKAGSSGNMKDVIAYFKSKNKINGAFILKIQNTTTLNESTREVIQLMEGQKYCFKQKMSKVESRFIEVIEKNK